MSDTTDPWAILKRPFPFSDIEIKPQSVSKDKDSALAVAYINARAAQDRLDEAFGPAGWSFEVRPCQLGTKVGAIGRLIVWFNGREVVREDAAESTDIEAIKGAVSGAFKRCFSALGNRTLYEVDLGWRACEKWNGKFSNWTRAALQAMEADYARQVMPHSPSQARPGVQASIDAQSPPTPQEAPQEGNTTKSAAWAKKASEILKGIVKDSDEYKQFTTFCKDNNLMWDNIALEAFKENVTSLQELIEYANSRRAA